MKERLRVISQFNYDYHYSEKKFADDIIILRHT